MSKSRTKRYNRKYNGSKYTYKNAAVKFTAVLRSLVGYPKIGRLILEKGNVRVYAYGAHKVVRICVNSGYNYSSNKADVCLAKHLISNPIPGAPRIFKAEYVSGASVILMRKYSRIGERNRQIYDRYGLARDCVFDHELSITYEVGDRKISSTPFWDAHKYNVGYYPKDPTGTPVCFDIWCAVG